MIEGEQSLLHRKIASQIGIEDFSRSYKSMKANLLVGRNRRKEMEKRARRKDAFFPLLSPHTFIL